MSAQIFTLATVRKFQVKGIADTEDSTVRLVYFIAASPYLNGELENDAACFTPHEVVALGELLANLGRGMLAGTLKRDANHGDGGWGY
jgi:hypothetical protein